MVHISVRCEHLFETFVEIVNFKKYKEKQRRAVHCFVSVVNEQGHWVVQNSTKRTSVK
jgi:hypothetical protein